MSMRLEPKVRYAAAITPADRVLYTFFEKMHSDEYWHLLYFVMFIEGNPAFKGALQELSRNPFSKPAWKLAARIYNGPTYATRSYDTLLEAAYNHIKCQTLEEVFTQRGKLYRKGESVVKVADLWTATMETGEAVSEGLKAKKERKKKRSPSRETTTKLGRIADAVQDTFKRAFSRYGLITGTMQVADHIAEGEYAKAASQFLKQTTAGAGGSATVAVILGTAMGATALASMPIITALACLNIAYGVSTLAEEGIDWVIEFGSTFVETGKSGCYFGKMVKSISSLPTLSVNTQPFMIYHWRTLADNKQQRSLYYRRAIQLDDLICVAESLKVSPELLWAFALVESDGWGFIPHKKWDEQLRPKVGIDIQIFLRLREGRTDDEETYTLQLGSAKTTDQTDSYAKFLAQRMELARRSPQQAALEDMNCSLRDYLVQGMRSDRSSVYKVDYVDDSDYDRFFTLLKQSPYAAIMSTGFGLFQMRGRHILPQNLRKKPIVLGKSGRGATE